MRYEISEQLRTTQDARAIQQLLYQQFRKISRNASIRTDGTVWTKDIEATFGSINRTDDTTIQLVKKSYGYLVVADINYRPSVIFWIFLLLSLFTAVGWLIPIVMYLVQKNTVRTAIEKALKRVKDEADEQAAFTGGSSQQAAEIQPPLLPLPPPPASDKPRESGNLMTCPHCGNKVSRRAKICPKCGDPIEGSVVKQPPIKCPDCGAELIDESKDCTECGCPATEIQEQNNFSSTHGSDDFRTGEVTVQPPNASPKASETAPVEYAQSEQTEESKGSPEQSEIETNDHTDVPRTDLEPEDRSISSKDDPTNRTVTVVFLLALAGSGLLGLGTLVYLKYLHKTVEEPSILNEPAPDASSKVETITNTQHVDSICLQWGLYCEQAGIPGLNTFETVDKCEEIRRGAHDAFVQLTGKGVTCDPCFCSEKVERPTTNILFQKVQEGSVDDLNKYLRFEDLTLDIRNDEGITLFDFALLNNQWEIAQSFLLSATKENSTTSYVDMSGAASYAKGDLDNDGNQESVIALQDPNQRLSANTLKVFSSSFQKLCSIALDSYPVVRLQVKKGTIILDQEVRSKTMEWSGLRDHRYRLAGTQCVSDDEVSHVTDPIKIYEGKFFPSEGYSTSLVPFHAGSAITQDQDHWSATLVKYATGDVNGDGLEDVVAIITTSGGGSGYFYDLELALNRGDGNVWANSLQHLGDRISVLRLDILDNEVVLDGVLSQKDDASCCPTEPVELKFKVSYQGTLIQDPSNKWHLEKGMVVPGPPEESQETTVGLQPIGTLGTSQGSRSSNDDQTGNENPSRSANQSPVPPRRITFEKGATNVSEEDTTNAAESYILWLLKGQTMQLSLVTYEGNVQLSVTNKDGAILSSWNQGSFNIPESGDYLIDVTPSAGEEIRFRLNINVVFEHQVRLNQARKLYENRQYDDALKECEAVLSIDPNNQAANELKKQIQRTIEILRN